MQLFIEPCSGRSFAIEIQGNDSIEMIRDMISETNGIPAEYQRLLFGGKQLVDERTAADYLLHDACTIRVLFALNGGMDFQNRAGSKPGAGGVMSESQAGIDRRERLRKLALETVDLSKDPYFMKNHVGTFECKLCLTLHNNEGNYLAHTQGKRHQTNLARRAAKEAADAPSAVAARTALIAPRRTIKIGRPGYKVVKQRDPANDARSLLFQIAYPEHKEGLQPRHRFMSAFEQRIEATDKNFQYLLFACEPYETIGFKIPNQEIDKSEGRFFTNWDPKAKTFTLQLYYIPDSEKEPTQPLPPPPKPKLRYHS